MNKERLLKLAEVLETESRGRVLTVPGSGKVEFDMGLVISKNGCGTAACAMGYAGLHPWFNRRGLVYDGFNGIKYRGVPGTSSFRAAAAFFEISRYDADELFTSSYAAETPKQVAKRIREFVAAHQ